MRSLSKGSNYSQHYDLRNPMIQLIEKQQGKYTLKINGVMCVFMPMCLFCGRSIIPLKPFVPKGKSVIKWKVNGKQVSYNQIKQAIKLNNHDSRSENVHCNLR